MQLPVVVVSGWGMPSWFLDACLPAERDRYCVTPEELLVGTGDSPEAAVERRLAALPEHAVWIGWSLGGQLAMAASARVPERVAAVITLCASPRFVAGGNWSAAVAPRVFDDFRRRLQRSTDETLSHFSSLMIHGAQRAGEERRWLRRAQWPDAPEYWRLERTLGWLGELDQRGLWSEPPVRSLHLFGGKDALVPASVGHELELEPSRCRVIPGMGHWPGGYFAGTVRELLEQCCDRVER